MKPLQVFVDETDLRRLEEWSRGRGWTKSAAVRAAIRALTRPRDQDPLLGLSGMVQGLPPDLSEQFDRHLGETFVAQSPPKTQRPRRARPRVRR